MRFARLLVMAIGLAALPQAGQAQDVAQAQALLDRNDHAGAMRIAEPLCLRANEAACDLVEKAILTPGQPGYDAARFVRIMSAACLEPSGTVMCGYAALVASGSSDLATDYVDWGSVNAPGRRGCAQGDLFSCYSMSQLLANTASPYRNLAGSIPFSRAACEGDVLYACFHLMSAVQELPEPALGTYADEYVLSFERACQLGETRACSEIPRARTMQQRAARYGAATAMHMLVVDNGLAEGNWGGSVMYALEDARSASVLDYTVGRVAEAGRMADIRQQDLPVIVRMLGNTSAAQSARNEMNRRARLDRQYAQSNSSSNSSSWSNSTSSSSRSSTYTPPPRQQTCTESYTGGGSGVNGRGQRIVRCN